MTKEKLTLSNVKKDMLDIIKQRKSAKTEYRVVWILIILFLTFSVLILAWFVVPHPYRILLPFIPAGLLIYHVVRYILEIRPLIQLKNQLIEANEPSSFSISIKTLNQISTITVYEPYWKSKYRQLGDDFPGTRYGLHYSDILDNPTLIRKLKTVPALFFDCGTSWRIPLSPHYEWSKDLRLSGNGLDNTSLKGNEFFYISFNKDNTVAYVYNTKLFELSPELKAFVTNK